MPKVQKHCIADAYFYFEGSVSYAKRPSDYVITYGMSIVRVSWIE